MILKGPISIFNYRSSSFQHQKRSRKRRRRRNRRIWTRAPSKSISDRWRKGKQNDEYDPDIRGYSQNLIEHDGLGIKIANTRNDPDAIFWWFEQIITTCWSLPGSTAGVGKRLSKSRPTQIRRQLQKRLNWTPYDISNHCGPDAFLKYCSFI